MKEQFQIFVLIAMVSFIMIWGVTISFPNSAIKLPFSRGASKHLARTIFPEGFSFFTRNPREPRLYLYQVKDGEVSPMSKRNGAYLMGISRKGRAMNVEIGMILKEIGQIAWYRCTDGFGSCQTTIDTSEFIKVSNNYERPLLNGQFILVARQPVPWAYHEEISDDEQVCDFLKIEIN